MQNRLAEPLTRNFDWGAACAKIGLVAILLVPGFLTARFAVPQSAKLDAVPVAKVTEKQRPKELVKIYSIVKANRPDIAEREAWKVSDAILNESAKRNLDPMLVLAVIKVESGFRNQAVSPVGARGIMQIMPETGKFLSEQIRRSDGFRTLAFRPDHLHDPVLNIKLGVYYLNDLKKQFRNLSLALLAYNLGPSELQNRLDNQIHYSDGYAAVVLDAYREYKKQRASAF